jgi:acetoin utilization protein AcuB
MFAIYNNNGLSFRNTIDNLYSLPNIDALARVKNNPEEGLPKDHSVKQKKRLYGSDKSLEEAKDAYKQIANIDTREPIFHVKDIMSKEVLFLNEENSLNDVYDLMEDENIRQVPIVNKETNHIIGMITQKDILEFMVGDIEFAQSTMKRTIASFNLGEVITTDPLTDIRRIAKVMVDFSLTAIPIVDQEDTLQGIVSRANILKAVANTPPFQIWG